MRRALLRRLPRLTRFTYGAIHPLNVEELTLAELGEYLTAMDKYEAELAEQQRRR